MSTDEAIRKKLLRGTGVNFVGIVAKSINPLYLIVITQLFGPDTVGVFVVASRLLEIALAASVTGFIDGALLFTSRHVDAEGRQDRAYRVMASALAVSLMLAVAMIGLTRFGGPTLIESYFALGGLVGVIQVMALALPLMALSRLFVTAAKALMIMEHDALLLGFLRPLLLLVFSAVFWAFDLGLLGLAWAYFTAELFVLVGAWILFCRHFDGARLLARLRSPTVDRELVAFAIPQSANMAFTTLISGIDIVMLGLFRFDPALIAFYAAAAEIARQIRQVRLGISGAFSPVIARFHAAGRTAELGTTFNVVSRWTAVLALPVFALLMIFHRDLLILFHPSYIHDTQFFPVLASAALFSCALGLAGNLVVMSGHSLWNLGNSVTVGVTNIALNWWWIPRWGLMGAATATLVASVLVTTMQLVEAHYLLRVRLRPRMVYAPYLSALVVGALLAGLWVAWPGMFDALPARIAAGAATVVIYVGVLRVVPGGVTDPTAVLGET